MTAMWQALTMYRDFRGKKVEQFDLVFPLVIFTHTRMHARMWQRQSPTSQDFITYISFVAHHQLVRLINN